MGKNISSEYKWTSKNYKQAQKILEGCFFEVFAEKIEVHGDLDPYHGKYHWAFDFFLEYALQGKFDLDTVYTSADERKIWIELKKDGKNCFLKEDKAIKIQVLLDNMRNGELPNHLKFKEFLKKSGTHNKKSKPNN